MNIIKGIALLAVVGSIAACDKQNKTVDRGIDSKDLSTLKAGIWTPMANRSVPVRRLRAWPPAPSRRDRRFRT